MGLFSRGEGNPSRGGKTLISNLHCFVAIPDSRKSLQLTEIIPNTWEILATDREAWRRGVKDGAHRAEMKARAEATIKRGTRKKRQRSDQEATNYICSSCNKDCHSRIGLLSHSRAHQH